MRKALKLLTIIIAVALMQSCRTPLSHVTYYIDYQEASQGKVFITQSNTVAFEYEPLGSILVEEIPGTVKITVPNNSEERPDEVYGEQPKTKTVTTYSEATAQSALNFAVEKTMSLGGDGLINLNLTSYIDKDKQRIVQVSGMVIKRK